MDKHEANRAAHLFYGMSAEMYDEGWRYDWDNMVSTRTPSGSIKFSVPIIDKDGKPMTVTCNRPNTMGRLTGIDTP